MKNVQHIICAMCGFISVAASIALADPPKESIAGIYLVDYDNPEVGQFIKFGDYPPVPPNVQADLDAFNQSLAQAPVDLRDGWIEMSDDGRAFGLGKTARAEEPHGVWIWPNWRDPSPIVFEQFSYFFFVGNRHVILYHGDISAVVDLQDPETLYTLPGVGGGGTSRFHVTNEGRWAGVPLDRRKVLIGQFDPAQPSAGAAEAQAVELPTAGEIEFLMWVRNGAYLVVEIMPDGEEEPKLFVVRATDLNIVDSADSAYLFDGAMPVGSSSTYGGIRIGEEWESVFFTVSEDGQLAWQPSAFPNEEEGDERPAAFSPSGRFTLNYWDEVVFEDVGDDVTMTEVLQTDVRHTHLADPEESLPTRPIHDVDGQEVVAGRYFWLSWE